MEIPRTTSDSTEKTLTARESFAEKLMQTLNSAGLAMMISIGYRTGLFDAMAEMPPLTSRQIADRTGLHERYVREWEPW